MYKKAQRIGIMYVEGIRCPAVLGWVGSHSVEASQTVVGLHCTPGHRHQLEENKYIHLDRDVRCSAPASIHGVHEHIIATI